MAGRRAPRFGAAPLRRGPARFRCRITNKPHRGRTVRRIVILGAGIALVSSVLGAAPGLALHTAGLATAGPVGSTIPRLPTVTGDPTAVSTAVAAAGTPLGAPLAVVALGDSIPKGYDCPDCTPFPELLGESLHPLDRATAPITNLGVGGWTSDDLLDSLTADPASDTAAAVAAADVITVTIGANDFYPGLDSIAAGTCGGPDNLDCEADAIPHLQANLSAILDGITALRGAAPVTVLVTGYWNVFPDGDVAVDQYGPDFLDASADLTAQANGVIAATAAAHHDTYVDLGDALGAAETTPGDITPLLTDDGDHPSQSGHHVIADALHSAVLTVRGLSGTSEHAGLDPAATG